MLAINRIMAITLGVFALMYFVGSIAPAKLPLIYGTATMLGPFAIALGLLAGLAAVVLHLMGRVDFWSSWAAANTGLVLCGTGLLFQMTVVPFAQLAAIAGAGAAAGGALLALGVARFHWLAPALIGMGLGGLWLGGTNLQHHSGFAAPLATGCACIAIWIGERRWRTR